MSLLDAPHTCHHPTCKVPVPEAMLACKKHWFELPPAVRSDIWRAYKPGQERTKTPGAAWWAAYAAAVDAWGFPEQAKLYRALVIRAERRETALRAIELDNALDGTEKEPRVTASELLRMIKNYGVEMEAAGAADAEGGNPEPKWQRARALLDDIERALDRHYDPLRVES